jgi:hypothetical protein
LLLKLFAWKPSLGITGRGLDEYDGLEDDEAVTVVVAGDSVANTVVGFGVAVVVAKTVVVAVEFAGPAATQLPLVGTLSTLQSMQPYESRRMIRLTVVVL